MTIIFSVEQVQNLLDALSYTTSDLGVSLLDIECAEILGSDMFEVCKEDFV